MKKFIIAPLVGAFLMTSVYAEETSAFLAGDINSANPYGLTDSEKVMLKNKELSAKVSSKVGNLEEQMEGVRSVLDGTSQRMNEIDRRLKALEMTYGEDSDAGNLPTKVKDLRAYVAKSRKIQTANNKKVKQVLSELSSLIDSINANYVSKKEYSELLKRVDKLDGKKSSTTSNASSSKKAPSKKTETKKPSTEQKTAELSGSKAHELGKKAYKANKLKEARSYFMQSIEKKYKPATSNFMLGEVSYKQKSFADAISHYKKSVELYDKASYMPKLLYHTAVSFDKLGDKENANKFYKVVKTNYPDSKEAKASPSR